MAFKLDIDDRREGLCIGWYDTDDCDFGLMLGHTWSENEKGKRPADDESAQQYDAEHAVAKLASERYHDVFVFETMTKARAALSAAKAAVKAGKSKRVVPEWEKTALAAGWKPPRGWAG